MNTYRICKSAVKSASLGSSVDLELVPCDRDATLESVIIASRAGITKNNTNFGTLAVKNGATLLASRAFNDAGGDLAAKTPEVLAVTGGAVSSSTCLALRYDHTGTGGGIDLDVTLVFRLSRP